MRCSKPSAQFDPGWSTDKDGIILGLLAAEITARTGRDPAALYAELTTELGTAFYARIDAPATSAQKKILKDLSPDAVAAGTLAGEPIRAKLTIAPGNGATFGGLKIVADNGWFAARPSSAKRTCTIFSARHKRSSATFLSPRMLPPAADGESCCTRAELLPPPIFCVDSSQGS